MTCITDVKLSKAISVVAAEIRLELNVNSPVYEDRMECTEAMSRIRQLLTAVCELYEIKEMYWEETSALKNVISPGAEQVLDVRHYALNETIYQRLTEVGYLSQYLTAAKQREVDDMVDMMRPYLDKCVPRSSKPARFKGDPGEDPQEWYIARRPDVSGDTETVFEEVLAVTVDAWGANDEPVVTDQPKRRTRSSKFA